jgi:gluconolactonase
MSGMHRALLLSGLAAACYAQSGSVIRKDPALDKLIPANAAIEKIAGGFVFTEGPLWLRDGSLIFSDVPQNVIYRWTADGKTADWMRPSGYDKPEPPPKGAFVGSNGITMDAQGRVVICQHGNGQVVRREKDGKLTVLAAKYEGKRLNSPNDAVYAKDGSLYFTDPPYGFVGQDKDPKKELDFNGVFRLSGSTLTLLTKELTRPNGLAFSPDQKVLYVANSDAARKIWMRYEVKADGTLGAGKVFADVTAEKADGLPDGLKVDSAGNVWATGPAGVWIFDPSGKHLGTVAPTEVPANCHWGDADGKTLYMTARTGVYRIRTNIAGIRP